jgi:hypothetical protein
MNETPNTFFENAAFREYIFLLVELERLFRENRGQTAEADVVRDEMDAPGDRLDAEEMNAVREFAGDLTRLSERYASILLPTERPTRSSPDTTVGNLPPLTEQPLRRPAPGQEPRPREFTP